jgi:hypothetical protein
MMFFSNLLTQLKSLAKQRNPRFSWSSSIAQWALGMYFATPCIALLQGSLMLNDYRVRHADAPRPIMPARGVAVAVDDEQAAKSWSSYYVLWRIRHPFTALPSDQPPLRLLVVGDSLAAGVGISKSGVPILPESIARALSKALDGRAVHWTCIGTPGVAASQIVKDIHEIETYDPNPRSRQLERIVKEFQARRRLWMERRRRQEEKLEASSNGLIQVVTSDGANADEKPKNYIRQWWEQIHQSNENNLKSPKEIRETTRNNIEEWWKQVRNKFRQRREKVEEDISAIKGIVLEPLPILDGEDDDYFYDYYREHPLEEEAGSGTNVKDRNKERDQIPLIRKGSVFRRSSVNAEAAAQYDIAVVLTGLNDVKEAFMPHMMMASKQGKANEATGDRRLQTELFRVLEALQDKMRGMDLEHGVGEVEARDNSSGLSNSVAPLKRPLVVVPELPVAPLQLFRLVPLCWFLVPIFRAMEDNKKFLASCFPQYVVFVEQPDLHWWTDPEAGIGPVRENIQQEQLLLRVTDITHTARERIENLMKQYYHKEVQAEEKELPAALGRNNIECIIENDTKIRMMDDHDHLHYDVDRKTADPKNSEGQLLGSNLVSIDKVHPNDEGYELWGRHIAAAIIKHWNNKV